MSNYNPESNEAPQPYALIDSLLQAGDWRAALELALDDAKFNNEQGQALTLVDIIIGVINQSSVEENDKQKIMALTYAKIVAIEDSGVRDYVWHQLARKLLEIEEVAIARYAVEQLSSKSSRMATLQEILSFRPVSETVRAVVREWLRQELSDCEAAIQNATLQEFRYLLEEVAKAYALFGEWDNSLAAIARMSSPEILTYRARTLAYTAQQMLLAGERAHGLTLLREAEELAASVPRGIFRAAPQSFISQVWAQAEEWDEALRVVTAIEHHSFGPKAGLDLLNKLVKTARHYADGDYPPELKRAKGLEIVRVVQALGAIANAPFFSLEARNNLTTALLEVGCENETLPFSLDEEQEAAQS
jgi:hypothetical protein